MIQEEKFKEFYYQEKVGLNIPPRVAISGVALLSLLPKDTGLLKVFSTFSFYEQSQFYSSGTILTESICSANPRIRGQMLGLKRRFDPSSFHSGPFYIEAAAFSKNIIYDIGNVILTGSNDLQIN